MSTEKRLPPQGEESEPVLALAQELLRRRLQAIARDTDHRLALLLLVEWMASMCAATWISPLTWTGQQSAIHPHIWLSVWLGGVVASFPFGLAMFRPGAVVTRHAMGAAQMLMAGLLVHLTGGHLEAHFAYFGLVAFLSFYRDWKVLVTATAVAGLDHLVRGLLWPESMYGVFVIPFWRPLEHVAWVLFEVGLLIDFLAQGRKAMLLSAIAQARLQGESDRVAAEVRARTTELENSEKRYGIMFQDSPLPMWLYDAETKLFLAANREAVQRFGYSEVEFLALEAEALFLDAIGGEQCRVRARDGSIREVEIAAHPVEWSGRSATLLFANEITEQKRKERDAREIQLRHNQKLESIGQLASGIAHEINTPTQYIGDNLHFLKESFGEISSLLALHGSLLPQAALKAADTPYLMEEIPKALDQALEGVTRVATLVKAMKEFSHPGQREHAPADLNRAIESTITVARNEWKYVATMETDLDSTLPLVSCLVSDLNQVLLNIIVNASHAIADTARDGSMGVIAIRTRKVGDCAEIRIRDSGGGIPEAARDRIFEPFFTTKGVGKGTGQGLAIAHSVVVDKHDGTIHFETELGRGTEFVIRLPLGSQRREKVEGRGGLAAVGHETNPIC